jgi:hypothetical protein
MAALKQQSRGSTQSIAAIVNHPLRARCWTVLVERVASPNELKDLLGATIGDVSYHVDVLKKIGVIELVKTEPRRGAVEHFYRAIERPTVSDEDYASMSVEDRTGYARDVCRLAFADVTASFDEGTFTRRTDHAVIRVPTVVDEEGWQELNTAYTEMLERIFDIQAASAERASHDPEATSIQTTALAMFFEMPDRRGAAEGSDQD